MHFLSMLVLPNHNNYNHEIDYNQPNCHGNVMSMRFL